jgi:hypothetical protein
MPFETQKFALVPSIVIQQQHLGSDSHDEKEEQKDLFENLSREIGLADVSRE